MTLEELILALSCVLHALLRVDVLLATVDYTDKTELEGVHPSRKDVKGIRAGVHNIELGEHADSAPPLRVDGSRELERVGVCEVGVGGGDSEDYAGVCLLFISCFIQKGER